MEYAAMCAGVAGPPLTMMPTGSMLILATGTAAAIVAMSILAIVGLAIAAHQQRDTTLVAPLLWAMLPLALLAAMPSCERLIADQILASCTFAAPLAVLGAKQPQNRGWPFVIIAFLAISAGPLVVAYLTHEERSIAVLPVWFYYVLVALTLVNYLPTRLWVGAGLWSAGQIALITGNRDFARFLLPGGVAAGLLFARFLPRVPGAGWNRVWLDFRDYYGLTWALRVAERLNATAEISKSNMRLNWRGFRCIAAANSPAANDPQTLREEMKAAEIGVQAVFCRFVSSGWIERRLR